MIEIIQNINKNIGLPTNENHKVFRWHATKSTVFFSAARQGLAITTHFATKTPMALRRAIPEWCEFIFTEWEWCKVIFAKITKKSVGKLIKHFGFDKIAVFNEFTLYSRFK